MAWGSQGLPGGADERVPNQEGGETGQFIDRHQKTARSGPWAGQHPSPGSVLLLGPCGRKLLLQFPPHTLIHLLKLLQSVCTGKTEQTDVFLHLPMRMAHGLSPEGHALLCVSRAVVYCEKRISLPIGDRAGGEGTRLRVTAHLLQHHGCAFLPHATL